MKAYVEKHLFLKDLGFLFQYFNSDKGSKLYNQYDKPIKKNKNLLEGNSYHNFYEKFFKNKKQYHIELLELGSFKGNASAAFYFYFQNCKIISCDLFPDLFLYRSKRIKNFKLDTSSELEIKKKLSYRDYKFDIIVEDAGHGLQNNCFESVSELVAVCCWGFGLVWGDSGVQGAAAHPSKPPTPGDLWWLCLPSQKPWGLGGIPPAKTEKS